MTIVGIMLNSSAAIVVLIPLVFARSKGRIQFRNRAVAANEAAAKYDENPSLQETLIFSRDCAFVAVILVVMSSILLLLGGGS
jgi:hypothetical protein